MQSHSTVDSITAVFFFLKKAAIIIAILDQKTLHWELRKILPSGKCNCI